MDLQTNEGSSEKELAETKYQEVGQKQLFPVALAVEAFEKSSTSQQLQSALQLVIPKKKRLNSAGTVGRSILIETNHFPLTISGLNRAIHYNVTIEPSKPQKKLRMVMEEFRKLYYPQRYPAFDGVKNLYSSFELPFDQNISDAVNILQDEQTETYKVTIKFIALIDFSALNKYFQSDEEGNRHMVISQAAIQCLNVVLRNASILHHTPVGRSFFTNAHDLIIDLGQGLEVYYGFYQSTILGWKPFLNVDVTHKAFFKTLNIIDLIKELCKCNLHMELNKKDYAVIDKYLRNLKVKYGIPTQVGSNRVGRVNELDKPASKATFRTDDGSIMTVEYYFANVKSYQLRYPHMPCLWVGSKRRETKILLPVELCTLVSGQVANEKMLPNQASEMFKASRTSTTTRKTKVITGIKNSQFNSNPAVQEFGIFVSNELAKVNARVLKAPELEYMNRKVTPSKGVWDAGKFINGKVLNKWCIICVDSKTCAFANMMIRQGKLLGMNISRPTFSTLRLQHGIAMKSSLEKKFSNVKHMELAVVIIPHGTETYRFVKQAAELHAGILTQCIQGSNISRLNSCTVNNILLKVNIKLNGINHIYVQRPPILNRPCMIMGADVTHPNREEKHLLPSIAAVTSSYDSQALRYGMSCQLQKPGQEIISNLANIVRNHLLHFYKKTNHTKPERIIFFRDGVSDWQFQTVLNTEVQAIHQACLQIQKDGMYQPKITFLIVQKRHHTRLFPTSESNSEDKNFNVPVGTVVDTEIIQPTALDFYLLSHPSSQGVTRPTKYCVLWDDSNMNEDEVEQLTYHLCYTSSRGNRSSSYPAPTYYAHLAAARGRAYCNEREIDMENLQDEQKKIFANSEIFRNVPMFFI